MGTVQATDADADDNIDGLRDHRRGGPVVLLHRGDVGGADLQRRRRTTRTPQDHGNGDNTYMVEVTATSGTGTREKTTAQTITVTVTMAAAPDLVVESSLRVDRQQPADWRVLHPLAPRCATGAAQRRATPTRLRYYRSTDSAISVQRHARTRHVWGARV